MVIIPKVFRNAVEKFEVKTLFGNCLVFMLLFSSRSETSRCKYFFSTSSLFLSHFPKKFPILYIFQFLVSYLFYDIIAITLFPFNPFSPILSHIHLKPKKIFWLQIDNEKCRRIQELHPFSDIFVLRVY